MTRLIEPLELVLSANETTAGVDPSKRKDIEFFRNQPPNVVHEIPDPESILMQFGPNPNTD